ncbi:MAG: hypothetical protein ACO3ID_09885, partial [Candidatus Nanopelagicales bacterium]
TPVRFVRKGDEVFAILLGLPGMRTFGLRGVEGIDEITLPERMPVEPAYVVPLGTEARWAQEA